MTGRLLGSLALFGISLLSALITIAVVDRVNPVPLVLYPVVAASPMAVLLAGAALIRPARRPAGEPQMRIHAHPFVIVGPLRRVR